MVKKILSFVHRESNGVQEAALLLALFSLSSQLLGLLRDRLLAHYIGPSLTLDIYYSAFRIPDFLYVSAASLFSSTIIIPFVLDSLGRNSEEETKRFLQSLFKVFLVGMIFICAVAYALMPFIASRIFSGFTGEALETLISTSRIILLSPLLLGLSNLVGAITQLRSRFGAFALSPLFYNLGIIIGIIFFLPFFGISGVAYGVVLGALLHLLIQIPSLRFSGFRFNWKEKLVFLPQIQSLVAISLPRTLALSVNSLALLILIGLGTRLYEGSVSVFNFAYVLATIPLSLIGVSYSVAAFPTIARYFSEGNIVKFQDEIISTARQIIFWVMPAAFLFIILRAQIVRVVFGSGKFSWDDTRLTAAALALFAISIIAQSLILLFVRGYYAAGKTYKPLIVNIISSISIVFFANGLLYVFNHSFIFRFFTESLLRVDGVSGTEMLMLPLAYSLGTILNLLILWQLFRRDFFQNRKSIISKTFFQVLGAGFFMGFGAYSALTFFGRIFSPETFLGIFAEGLSAGLFGVFLGVIILYLLKNEELKQLSETLRSRFWKREVIQPEQIDL